MEKMVEVERATQEELRQDLKYAPLEHPQDDAEAARWYRMAAEQGHASAQYTLGLMYAIGSGVLKDATLAHMWLSIAGANGSEIAREWRDTIEDDMTATQIARATELARTCMDSDYENCEG